MGNLPGLPDQIAEVAVPEIVQGQNAKVALAECRAALGQANTRLRSASEFYGHLKRIYG